MDKEKMEKRVGICPQPTMSSNLFFYSCNISDVFRSLSSIFLCHLPLQKERKRKNRQKMYIYSSLDGESSSDALWYSDSLPHLPSSSLSIVQLWHSKRDGYIWGMENRQSYYVWGLFSQNRVWHVTRLKVFLVDSINFASSRFSRLPTPHFNQPRTPGVEGCSWSFSFHYFRFWISFRQQCDEFRLLCQKWIERGTIYCIVDSWRRK